jgi:hypothetical protein
VGARLREDLTAAKKSGIKIAPDAWGIYIDEEWSFKRTGPKDSVCALGCFLLAEQARVSFQPQDLSRRQHRADLHGYDFFAAERLDIHVSCAEALRHGFDGSFIHTSDFTKPWYNLGAKLREEFTHAP